MGGAASTREFRTDPVSDAVIYRVLDTARFAPSGGNRQGWRVIVVRNPDVRKALRDLYLRSWILNMQPLFAHLRITAPGRPIAMPSGCTSCRCS